MVDLISQYRHIENEINDRFREICESSAFIGGKYVKAFSSDLAAYMNVKHVIPCANGTDALQLALMALQLKPGDEVITTAFTFVATAEVIALLGLKPVFADIDEQTFNIDVEDVERKITPHTKCIIPVHLFGQAADMDAVMNLSRKHNIPVIEDNAQSIGCFINQEDSKGYTGSIGNMGTCSFFPSKNLGCYGDGGAVTTNDDDLAHALRMVANHGSAIRYHHTMIGVNSRLDNLQAAVLYTKLPHLDAYNTARQFAADYYDELLSDVEEVVVPFRDQKSKHVFHQYTLRIKKDRDGLANHLKQNGIAHGIYYPIPLHLQEAYLGSEYGEGDLPNSEQACREVLSLPMHSELTRPIQETVINAIKAYYA